MRKDNDAYPSSPQQVQITHRPTFIGSGAFHYVFKIQANGFSPMVYKVQKESFNGKIGNYFCRSYNNNSANLHKTRLSLLTTAERDRGIRIWKQVNPGVFIMKYELGILAPYFDEHWTRPNDETMRNIVTDVYHKTQRIFIDIFCDNVRLSPSKDSYVVIDTDCLLNLKKTHNPETNEQGYESEGSEEFSHHAFLDYFQSYSDLYPKSLNTILHLLFKENETDKLGPLHSLQFCKRGTQSFYYNINLYALFSEPPVNATFLLTKEYINFCCRNQIVGWLYASTIMTLLHLPELSFDQKVILVQQIITRIQRYFITPEKKTRLINILATINDLPLSPAQEQRLFGIILQAARHLPGNIFDIVTSYQSAYTQSILDCILTQSRRLSTTCIERIIPHTNLLNLSALLNLSRSRYFHRAVQQWVSSLYSITTHQQLFAAFAQHLIKHTMNQSTLTIQGIDLKLMTMDPTSSLLGEREVLISNALSAQHKRLLRQFLRNSAVDTLSIDMNVNSASLQVNQVSPENALTRQKKRQLLSEFNVIYTGGVALTTYDELCLALLVTQPSAATKGWWFCAATGYGRWQTLQRIIGSNRSEFNSAMHHSTPAGFFSDTIQTLFSSQPSSRHILRRFHTHYGSTVYNSLTSLASYLYRTRRTAHTWGWWFQPKTGYASWIAITKAIGISRESCLRLNSATELHNKLLQTYQETHQSIRLNANP